MKLKLTKGERKVLRLSADMWNTFLALTAEHPDEREEFRHALHALQNVVFARPARRLMWHRKGPK